MKGRVNMKGVKFVGLYGVKIEPAAHSPTLPDQLFIPEKYIEIQEVKRLQENNVNEVRVYRSSPGSINLQLRAYCGIGEFGDGIKRNMIATSHLSFAQAKELAEYLLQAIVQAEGA